MTVYNRQHYLNRAITSQRGYANDSILLQTYPHWQIAIWDDGSTDSSPTIARARANLDPRIKFIATPHIAIATTTRNT